MTQISHCRIVGCNNQIHRTTFLYGTGICRSHAQRNKLQKYYFSKEFLIEEYLVKDKSKTQIALENKCSPQVIAKYIKKYNLIKIQQKKRYLCIDCGVDLANHYATRCHRCYVKLRRQRSKDRKIHRCIDCGIEIKKPSALRCIVCYLKFVKKEYFCECGVSIDRRSTHCNSCAMKYRVLNHPELIKKKEKHWNWKDGKSLERYPLNWTHTFKEQIRYRDGYKCQLCGCPEIENKQKLSIHHIDYNKMNLDPCNLISLCLSCHIKTNNNRNDWQTQFSDIMNDKTIVATRKF